MSAKQLTALMPMDRPLLIGWPNQRVGGAGLYLLRFAEEFQKQGGKIWIFDIEPGLLNTRLRADSRFISTTVKGWDIPAGCDALLPVGYATEVGNMIRLAPDCRLCLVSMHEHEMFSWHKFGFIYKKFGEQIGVSLPRFFEPLRNRTIRFIVSGLSKAKALYHVCGYNFEFDRRIVGLNEPNFLPIPVPKYPILVPSGKSSFAWLSRLTSEKLKPLYELIDKIALLPSRSSMSIIGYGPELENLRKYCLNKSVEVEFPGVLEGEKLQSYLADKKPVCFGVGTSILELASMGFPAVVVSVYSDLRGNDAKSYAWVYDLGEHDMALSSFSRAKMISLADVIQLTEDEYQKYADLCRKYVWENYSAENTARKIKNANREPWPFANELSNALNSSTTFRMARSLKKLFIN